MPEDTQPQHKPTLTVALRHFTTWSKKTKKHRTRGWYLNIPQEIVLQIGLRQNDLVEITLEKLNLARGSSNVAEPLFYLPADSETHKDKGKRALSKIPPPFDIPSLEDRENVERIWRERKGAATEP